MSAGGSDETPPTPLDVLLDGLHRAATGDGVLPVVRGEDAEAVYGLFHEQMDRVTEARAEMAEGIGNPVACARLCSHCCNNSPAIFAGEAVVIARWLDRPEHAEVRAGFLERYPAWFARVEDLLRAWAAAATAGDDAAAEQALTEVWRRAVMCAFNQDGACTIYEVRPIVCRNAHALNTPDNCRPDTTIPASRLRFTALEDYMKRILPVVYAMHAALHQDGTGSAPLCVAVHDELHHPSGT